ncbi:response regulator [Spirosoma sp. KCTC 42546]|uniref:hybrid sensor histidine kinase/response regulator transcription factor n=1 Tax=Spirosoma sp. KCTC 42546 TaxID=2520506 RepID=UPI0011573E52|nr:ATP-binding protein [Spirosoma sp. KCTC 42546]QDK81892.1 response regulator [Spirosoma sp. KCTC 42546]
MTLSIPSIIRTLVCLMSLLASSGSLRAQSFRLPQPQVITDRQGLPQAFVPSILQDKQGFIWVATRDGLCRYDGQRFKVFQPDPDGRPSLSFAGLNQLELDRHGRIWILSERMDIDVFDPRTETFTNISRQAAFRRLVKPGTAYKFRIDRQDRLWLVVFGTGILCWDVAKKQGQWFRHQPRQAASLITNSVNDLLEGADGTIWLATSNGLDRFEEASHRFTHIRHQPGQAQSLPEDSLGAVRLRPTGELMLFSRYYLTLLQPRTGQLRSYRLPAQGNDWLGAHTAIDRQGTVYFGRIQNLFRFTDQQGVQLVAHWDQPNDECRSLLVDRTNVLWMGTTGAGIRTYNLQPSPFQKHRYQHEFYWDLLTRDSLGLPPVPPAVLASLRGLINYNFRSTFDRAGCFWFNVGTSDLYRLDRETGQAGHFPLPIRLRYLDGSTMIPFPMTTDPKGRVWAVYHSTAFWFDEPTRRWNRFPYPIPISLSSGPITELVVDEQALWLASQVGGLWRLDRHNGEIRQFVNRPGDATSLSSNTLYCLSADPADGNRLWIGTFGSGLCLFDKRTGRFRRFTQAQGLPNNVVYSALADRYGYLWMGTNKGLCRMNRRSFTTQTFTRDDGIMADEFNRYHYVRFPEGNILMGGLEGFTLFNTRQIGQDTFEPRVELTELQVNNQIVQPDLPEPDGTDATTSANRSLVETSVLGTLPIQATSQLTLAHNQNYLTVQFAALQFNRPAKNRYRYRLEGLEDAWKETNRPEANYTNLPPGDYVLLLNTSNTSDRWSRYVRKLAITIQPPFWATWWAYGLYALIGLSMAWALLQVYLNRIRLNQTIQLRQQEADQLRAVDTMKSNFFTNITHEFRTPLALILGPTEQMASENPGPKNRRRLQTIEQNAHQLLGLINQLLDLSKLEASVMPIHESRGNLTEFVQHWLNPLTDQAAMQGLHLTFTSEVTGDYWFDAEKLERIVYNLTANALKFTKAGTITVTLTEASGPIRLTVADTGVGISAQDLPHIFDRFYQVSNTADRVSHRSVQGVGPDQSGTGSASDTTATPGTGIGLALVQELVLLQGGHISVESQLNQGTTFVVELPYRRVDASDNAPDGATHWHRETSDDIGEASDESDHPRLLVVEDNDELARFIAESLPRNYRIQRAVNGQDGLKQALEQMPDLILSDVMMPLMDGFTLCNQLKADLRTSHIPVILLTAKSSVENRLAGLSLGADDYLTKPFQITELQLRVRNQLVSKQRQREWVQASLRNPDPASPPPSPETTDPFLIRLYALFEANLSDSGFGLDQLMRELGMSRTNLFRKVKALTGLTAHELLRNYRLKQAAQLLRSNVSVSETAYQVGFESAAYFSKCFRELYQQSPSEFAAQA